MQIPDVEIVGGVPERLQVLYTSPQRRPDLRRRRLVVGPPPAAGPLPVGAVPRSTQMYVTVGSLGSASSGVWVLMNRRCVWASRSANTSVRARVTMSIHGESVSSGSGSSGSRRMSRAQIICVHVVPHFGGVLMMMSPGRSSKPSQRLLSYILAS